MRFLSTTAICLISAAGLAQSPQPGGPTPSAGIQENQAPPMGLMPVQGSAVTQKSRVRAFNAGPDGQIRSVYLSNGSVVDLSSSFGPGLNSQIHKGTRIRVTGSRTVVSGQTIIIPQQLAIGQQSFAPQPNPGPNPLAGMAPPANGGPGQPPPPPARADGMGQPPPPAGSGPVASGQFPGNTSGEAPPPPTDGQQPASGGQPKIPAPPNSAQPVPAPPLSTNL